VSSIKRIIEDRDDVEPLLRSFDIEILDANTDEDGNLELGEPYGDQDVTVAVLKSCGHPEEQVVSRMQPEGRGRCKLCGKNVEIDEEER